MFSASDIFTFDALLMDMLMPVLDGCEAARQIRALEREDAALVPIIACTASVMGEDREKATESGMNDFVTKPIKYDNLIITLGNLVGSW